MKISRQNRSNTQNENKIQSTRQLTWMGPLIVLLQHILALSGGDASCPEIWIHRKIEFWIEQQINTPFTSLWGFRPEEIIIGYPYFVISFVHKGFSGLFGGASSVKNCLWVCVMILSRSNIWWEISREYWPATGRTMEVKEERLRKIQSNGHWLKGKGKGEERECREKNIWQWLKLTQRKWKEMPKVRVFRSFLVVLFTFVKNNLMQSWI